MAMPAAANGRRLLVGAGLLVAAACLCLLALPSRDSAKPNALLRDAYLSRSNSAMQGQGGITYVPQPGHPGSYIPVRQAPTAAAGGHKDAGPKHEEVKRKQAGLQSKRMAPETNGEVERAKYTARKQGERGEGGMVTRAVAKAERATVVRDIRIAKKELGKDATKIQHLTQRVSDLTERNGKLKAVYEQVDQMAARIGPQGAQGDSGIPGVMGPRGRAGRDGVTGFQGTIGRQGKPGKEGARGIRGLPGRNGKPGKQGPRGRVGVSTEPGPQGAPGMPGRGGKRGREGAPGVPGQEGRRGPPGKNGADGRRGVRGERGPKGRPGVPGYAGFRGQDGRPGR